MRRAALVGLLTFFVVACSGCVRHVVVGPSSATVEAQRSGYFIAVACERNVGLRFANIPFDSIKTIVIDAPMVRPNGVNPATGKRDTTMVAAYSSPSGRYIVMAAPYRDNPFVWAHEYLHVFENDTTPETYHKKHRECGL